MFLQGESQEFQRVKDLRLGLEFELELEFEPELLESVNLFHSSMRNQRQKTKDLKDSWK